MYSIKYWKKSIPYINVYTDPARIVEYTSILFNYEHENVLLKCRTQTWWFKSGLFKNPKYLENKKSKREQSSVNEVGHTWLDNRNKQIKETNDIYELLNNGDLIIRNLTYQQHFGQFACITRKGNRIDSISVFIYPVSSIQQVFFCIINFNKLILVI